MCRERAYQFGKNDRMRNEWKYWVCMNYWLKFNGAYDFSGGVYQEEKRVRAAAVTEVRRKRREGTRTQRTRRKRQYEQ